MTSGSIVPTSIQHLPPEILSLIFVLVYVQHQDGDRVGTAEMLKAQAIGMPFLHTPETTWTSGVVSPTLFPFALAAVCTTWRDIMSTFPIFWTQLIMFANTSATLPDQSDLRAPTGLKHQLEWSGDLPLDIFIVSLPDDDFKTIEDERCIVREAIDILEPHLERCKTVNYDVVYSSSLPSIMTDLNHPTPHLSEIRLNAMYHSAKCDRSSLLPHPIQFCFPKLEYLAFDGQNFMDFSTNVPSWITRINDPMEDGFSVPLAISCYVEAFGERSEGDTFWDKLAEALPKIIHINFSSIMVPNPPVHRGLNCALNWLGFREVNVSLINEILSNVTYTEILKITNCVIGGGLNCGVNAFQLILEDIPQSDDISPLLSHWTGFGLTVMNCPSFNDVVLDSLAHKPYDPILSNLGSLHIQDCPNFTVSTMRRFVRRQKAKFAGVGDTYGGFRYLKVTGATPYVTKKEREWFQRNVSIFHWETNAEV